MPDILKILRSITTGNRPSSRVYGEPYVNFADKQFGVFDSSNVAQDLVGVTFFSTSASYSVGQPVVYQAKLYTALVAVSPGSFNPVQWKQVTPPGSLAILAMRVFTASGTYTPTAGMQHCMIECVGGGASGAGANTPGAATFSGSPGGGSGAYSKKFVTAATIGASQVVTIGGGGTAPTAGTSLVTAGVAGGDTSVGTICIAKGAPVAGITGGSGANFAGGAGGPTTGSVGDLVVGGSAGGAGCGNSATANVSVSGGGGGSSFLGGGGQPGGWGSQIGGNATGYGSGGAGGASSANVAQKGGNGMAGVVIITEYGS